MKQKPKHPAQKNRHKVHYSNSRDQVQHWYD